MALLHPDSPARLLWDQAGLWSLMALEALGQAGLTVWPVSAAEVAAGSGLEGARLLLVPGGWPRLKKAALGDSGAAAIAGFLDRGGTYVGFCGGAGLALDGDDGLGLVPLGRAAGRLRLPSASGPVRTEPGPHADAHPLWAGLTAPTDFHVWWPGQFADPPDQLRVVARYRDAAPGFLSGGQPAHQAPAGGWAAAERQAGIRLDPAALWGRPAVLEGAHGAGRVLLSYLHLDTPGDAHGRQGLVNLWAAWLDQAPGAPLAWPTPPVSGPGAALAARLESWWNRGAELELWRSRHPVMPLWPRGVRGLEFWTLVRLGRAAAAWAGPDARSREILAGLADALAPLEPLMPALLAAQAELLAGREPGADEAPAHHACFPAARRVGGPWRAALAALEAGVLSLVRLNAPGD